ncbi:MAG: hypothetical protein JO127_10995 [Caulobacteraceae bacterium]|nr:hypothetical protein [Caulobacteraceae bacterium]
MGRTLALPIAIAAAFFFQVGRADCSNMHRFNDKLSIDTSAYRIDIIDPADYNLAGPGFRVQVFPITYRPPPPTQPPQPDRPGGVVSGPLSTATMNDLRVWLLANWVEFPHDANFDSGKEGVSEYFVNPSALSSLICIARQKDGFPVVDIYDKMDFVGSATPASAQRVCQ